jgi:hypothetical protein
MIRAQIQFTEKQLKSLRFVARKRETSVANIVRQAVEVWLAQNAKNTSERYARAGAIVGSLEDPETKELAKQHDRYLSKAFSK